MPHRSTAWLASLMVSAHALEVRGQCPPQWLPAGAGMNAPVKALAVYNNELIAGGEFTTAGGQPASHIARWNGSTWAPLGTGMGGAEPTVYSLAVYNNELIAGGYFTSAGGQAANRIARWNGSTWAPLGTGVGGGYPYVWTLGVYNNEVIAGGYYLNPPIARWNGSTWAPLGSGYGGIVGAMVVYNNELVVGCQFAGGFGIARWNGSTWTPLVSGVGADELAVYNTDLIVVGQFSTIGGVPANRIARWNGSTWAALGAGLLGGSPSWQDARALTVYNNDLIAGGWFTIAGGQPANWIARWNGSAWAPLGTGLNEGVEALAVYNNELIAAGDFTTAGGQPSAYWARWGCACYPDCTADGALTVADFGCFQTKFVAGDPYADCNGDGQRTVADLGCFQTKFVVGCP